MMTKHHSKSDVKLIADIRKKRRLLNRGYNTVNTALNPTDVILSEQLTIL